MVLPSEKIVSEVFSAFHDIRLSFCFDFLCVHCVLHGYPASHVPHERIIIPFRPKLFSRHHSLFNSLLQHLLLLFLLLLNFLLPLSFSLNLFPPSSFIFLHLILPLHLISSSFYINWFIFFFNSSVSSLSLSSYLDFILLTLLFLSHLLLASSEYPVPWPAHLGVKVWRRTKSTNR